MYYFFLITIICFLSYVYKYYLILLILCLIHIFIAIILFYVLCDQMVIFKWLGLHMNDNVEITDSIFLTSSYTYFYWGLNILLLFFLMYLFFKNKHLNYFFYK